MTDLPRTVQVSFLLPGYGLVKETYDMLSVNDRACWGANAATYPQIGVTPITFATIPDDRPRRIAAWPCAARRQSAWGCA